MIDKISKEEAMRIAIEESEYNSENNYKNGGPFGAVILKNGEIVSIAHNTVIESKDPTAHAEVNAIRLATKKLNTHDLTGCTLYVNAEPCPMCLSAIIWANIKEVYYANTKEEAGNIGFRDDLIYDYIKNRDENILKTHHVENEKAKEIFEEFKTNENKIMY
jgi:guanine deaminase